MGCRRPKVEIKNFKNESFHLYNLGLGISVISDVGKISNLRWKDLLKLGGNVHSSRTYKLEF